MNRSNKIVMMSAGLFVFLGAAAFGSVAGAQVDNESIQAPATSAKCSNRSLRGDYGFSIEGTILAGTPNAFLLRGVAMTHFDGNGNLSQMDFTTRNGVPFSPDWRPAAGTYEINEDCTGSAHIVQSDGSPSLNLRLVVVDRGREVRTTVVGNSSSSVGIRVN